MNKIKIYNNNKCAFLMYNNFSIAGMGQNEKGEVYFMFYDSGELRECIEEFYDTVKDRRSVYVDLTLYNKIKLDLKELVKSYKRAKE